MALRQARVALTEHVRALDEIGHTLVSLSGSEGPDLRAIERLLEPVGEPLHVFQRDPFWRPLGVNLTRPLGSSGGIGLNTLHIDCVNAQRPPDIVCLYCVRSDPAGGGANIVAFIDGIEGHLSKEAQVILSLPNFEDGAVIDLEGVGSDVNPFPVLNLSEVGWKYRFSGRLILSAATASRREALHELNDVLWNRLQVVGLQPGQCLLVDQRRVVHGRLPLNPGQESIDPDSRRQLLQAYWRWRW